MEWKEVTATEYCSKIADGTHDSPKRQSFGKYLITSKHIKGHSIDFDNAYFISEDDYQKIIKRSKVDKWDVIISMIGEYCGFCYVEDSDFTDYAVKNVGIFKVGERIKSLWLYYYLTSPEGKAQLKSIRAGSSQPYISLGALRDLIIPVPSIEKMKEIVSILSSLDRKIELNNKINADLEEMAQAIFKNWFVDFEPFKDGKFVDSELGMIPEGWRVGMLEDLIAIKYGKDHKKLEEGTIPVYGSGGLIRFVNSWLYEGESVLIPRKGTLDNIMYVNEKFWTVDTMFFSVPKMEYVMKYVYDYIRRFDFSKMNEGTSVPSNTAARLNKMQILIPTPKVIEMYDKTLCPIYNRRKTNKLESSRLSLLRDTLLPRLMSGEIEVPE